MARYTKLLVLALLAQSVAQEGDDESSAEPEYGDEEDEEIAEEDLPPPEERIHLAVTYPQQDSLVFSELMWITLNIGNLKTDVVSVHVTEKATGKQITAIELSAQPGGVIQQTIGFPTKMGKHKVRITAVDKHYRIGDFVLRFRRALPPSRKEMKAMLRVDTTRGDRLVDMSKKDQLVTMWYDELLKGHPLATPNTLVRAKQVVRQPKSAKQDILLVAHVEPSNSYFAYQLEASNDGSYSIKVSQMLDEFEGLPPDRLARDDFEKKWQCQAEPQIEQDLKLFREAGGIKKEQVGWKAWERSQTGKKPTMGFIIHNNRVFLSYDQADSEIRWYEQIVVDMLLDLAQRALLPNVYFMVFLREAPLSWRNTTTRDLPVFSMTGSAEHADITMPEPFFFYWNGTREVPHPAYKPPTISNSLQHEEWANKADKVFWRGSVEITDEDVKPHGRIVYRTKLVMLSQVFPEYIDAAFTGVRAENETMYKAFIARYPLGKYVPIAYAAKFKYLINTFGNGDFKWNNRLRGLLLTGSAIFIQQSPLYEFWYRDLEPYKHYIPVKEDLSDLLEQVRWAKANDAKVENIASNGKRFALERLRMEHIYCYWWRLVWKYSELQKFEVTRPEPGSEFDGRSWVHHQLPLT